MRSYYCVYNCEVNPPMYRFDTLAEADQGSKRLSDLHPDVTFEVLKCIAITGVITCKEPQKNSTPMKIPTPKDEAFKFLHGIYPWERPDVTKGLQPHKGK